MRVLLYDMGSYTQADLYETLKIMNIECKSIMYRLRDEEEDAYFEKCVKQLLNENIYDAVISVNYFPILAKICKSVGLPYLSWSYDSPINVPGMEKTLGFGTNHVFFFDRMECLKYQKKGYENVHHLPLAVNTDRLDGVFITEEDRKKYSSEISMVGQLYDTSLQTLMLPMDEFDQGYITAAIETQLRLYGVYLLENMISQDLVNRVNAAYIKHGQTTMLRRDALEVVVAKHVTHVEREVLLGVLGEEHDLHLYGPDRGDHLVGVKWCGSAGYFDEMPKIFKLSKINLNISLKCIQTGIPLRVLDILGSGGFLLTNWQEEIAEYFTDGEELVMYSSIEDAVAKCKYYLEHEDERKAIANNGYRKVKELFPYEDRVREMLRVAGF